MTARIGVVGPNGLDDFASNIADGLIELGQNVELLGPVVRAPGPRRLKAVASALANDARRTPTFGRRVEHHVVAAALERELDLVITVESLRPDTVEALRDRGVRCALWFPDAVSNLGTMWMFAAPYSIVAFKEPVLVERVQRLLEMPIMYLAEACNPRIHRVPSLVGDRVREIAVVGNFYPTRVSLLQRLVSDGYPLRLYGAPLPAPASRSSLSALHTGRYVRGIEKATVFRSAAAVLNNLHPAEIEGINCRVFEATACGAAVVCEHRQALASHFSVGEEVLAFTDYRELTTELDKLLASHELSTKIGDAAAMRSKSDHTYAQRLTKLLERAM